MVKQLATADACTVHVRYKYRKRAFSYQRNKLIGGRKGKTIKSKLLAILPASVCASVSVFT